MVAWEDNILGFIPQADWLDVGFNVERPNDPADQLFGDMKTPNLVAEWQSIASEYQIPVMAQFHGFDTESRTTFRVPVDTHNIEKGLIKVKINQSERMRALLRNGVQNNDALYDYVVNDGIRLADQVVTRSKVAKNELLSTGKVTIKENNLNLTVDYGVPTAQTSLKLDFTADADKDIPAQLQGIVDSALDKGITLDGIFTSRYLIGLLRNDAAVQKAVNGNIGAGALVRVSALQEYLAEEFGFGRIITNDLTYGASASIGTNGRPSVTSKRYYPKDKITFFAENTAGRVGMGLWGDPPETDVSQFLQGGQSGVSPYVYVSQWAEKDPAVLWTKASALFMPVLYNPNSLFIATAKESE